MTNIIHFSRFVPVTRLGGGARRTRQIVELLESFHPGMVSAGRTAGLQDYTPADLGFGKGTSLHYYSGKDGKLNYWSTFDLESACAEGNGNSFPNRSDENVRVFSSGFQGVRKKKNIDRLWSPDHREKVKRFRTISAEWAHRIDLSQLSLALVDDPVYFLPLTGQLKEKGVPVAAVSHNIESLASHQVKRRCQRDLFNREIDALKKCDLVITISREEAWLLENLDINAFFLPYYPVEEILQRLLTIRENRQKTEKKDFLLIGSTVNDATRQGMSAVIDKWRANEWGGEGDRLLVAGYKSDVFLKDIKRAGARGRGGLSQQDSIEVLGPLSDEELDKVMSRVRAAIVYQEFGSGALTRIMETLAAGVPVPVNTHAARSYHNLAGVFEFHDLDELGTVFERIKKAAGQVPLPSAPDPEPVIDAMKKIMKI